MSVVARVVLAAIVLFGSLRCASSTAPPAVTPPSGGQASRGSAGPNDRVRVVTWNIHHAAGNDDCKAPAPTTPPAAECALNLQRVGDIVRSFEADVVALQEVDRFWGRTGNVDQASALGTMTGMRVCYGGNLDHQADDHAAQPHQYGTLILTKAPLGACWNTLLPRASTSTEQRGLLHAEIDVQGIRFHIFNTHLHTTIAERTVQAPAVDALVGPAAPAIVVGDFNAQPAEATLAPLQARFQDAWMAGGGTGNGFTIPAAPGAPPTRRIDYGFATKGITVTHAEVIANVQTAMAADHYPVKFDLRVPAR
jgi:endonuclease/exonuclease/phosphatase family metal-dependent hydrolase